MVGIWDTDDTVLYAVAESITDGNPSTQTTRRRKARVGYLFEVAWELISVSDWNSTLDGNAATSDRIANTVEIAADAVKFLRGDFARWITNCRLDSPKDRLEYF